ncbi:amidohydrolase [Bacillus norwichensis]|uniref:Amidohydrolase n=1 Tax=Bacillus norwichensis TaxID=2762217 RepID=A0ABR8VMM9_9BACI|nr:amidohydrolase [Bacillus norwichensis]MBD8005977.1 amidohydrolase [Bacillus norwichensis]
MKPDLILHHGTVVTMNQNFEIAEAVAVKGGKILAIGSNDVILQYSTPQTQVIDLKEKTVTPGFIDAHQHMINFGFNLANVNCRKASIEEVVSVIKERAEASRPEEWIIGWGYDEAGFKENRSLHKDDFEGIPNPVYIMRYCHHAATVNDKALKLAGITNETTVDNGIIEKDDSGEVTGVLVEQGKSLVENVMPPYTKHQMKNAVKLANDQYIKDGITSVHEAGLGFFSDAFQEFDVLKEMKEEGTLNVRMYVMVLQEVFEEFLKTYSSYEWDYFIKIGSMKFFGDGTLSGKTAAVSQDFKSSPGEKGMLLYSFADLLERAKIAHSQNKQIAVHAIGDRAINQVLDVYEKLYKDDPKPNLRHRVEHSTVTDEAILARMKKLEAIPVPQPSLVYFAGDVYLENLNEPAVQNVFANKNFIDAGLKPAGSSDCPIIPSSPLLGMAVAMDRMTVNNHVFIPDQRVSLSEALSMYTINAAYASFEEDLKGSLEEGKLADMVVLPEGFLHFKPEKIKETEVDMTIIGGEIVYSKGTLKT